MDFDADPEGTTPSSGPVSFSGTGLLGPPTVFTVPNGHTSSPPKALQASQPCNSGCANGAHQLRVDFARGASYVELYAGVGEGHGTEFDVPARLVGYDASGNQAGPAADSGDVFFHEMGGVYPIRTRFQISDPGARIRYAILYVGKGTRENDALGAYARARIDDLFAQVADGPPPPPPPDPPEPQVTITSPQEDAFLERPEDAAVSGRIEPPGDISAFCISSNSTERIPEPCSGAGSVRSDGTFGPIGVGGLVPGRNAITAWVRDSRSRVRSATVNVSVADASSGIDVHARGMYVLQAVQKRTLWGIDDPLPPNPRSEGRREYRGAKLIAGGRTVVRLMGQVLNAGRRGRRSVGRVPALLYGFRREGSRLTPLPGSPISPENGLRTLMLPALPTPDAILTDIDRTYNFTLPPSWTRGEIELRGEINTTNAIHSSALIECDVCQANNRFTTTGIRFEQRNPVTITPVEIIYRDAAGVMHRPPRNTWPVFEATRALLPIAEGGLNVRPYYTWIDVSFLFNRTYDADPRENFLKRRVAIFDWVGDVLGNSMTPEDRAGFPFGLHDGPPPEGPGGFATPIFANLGWGGWGMSDVRNQITQLTHEIFHIFAFRHVTNDCGGGGIGWPARRGRFYDMGLDRRPSRMRGPGRYRLVISPSAGGETESTETVDLMSYCASESSGWVSQRTWDSVGDLIPYGAFARAGVRGTQANGPTLRVVAGIDSATGRVFIGGVKPGTSGMVTPSDPEGDYRIVVRDGSGAEVSSTAVRPAPGEEFVIHGEVPAPGAARVEIVRGGTVVASRDASANPPSLSSLSPSSGTLPSSGNVRLSWEASDPDGDELLARVEYSVDGGRNYRVLTTAVPGREVSVPASLFAYTRDGRVRVTVNDGFRDATLVSGRVRSAGRRPQVAITSPASGARLLNDGTVVFGGEAYDDRGRAITGGRLTWFDGSRRIGSGEQVTATGLTPGRRTIRLEAVDSRGRRAAAAVRVRVSASRPAFVGLRVPARIGRGARRLRLRTGATAPGTLRVGGRRFTVTRRPRTYTVPVRPGRSTLRPVLRLTVGGRTTTLRVRVLR